MEAVHNLYNVIIDTLTNMGPLAPLLACLLILIESMVPILPLFLFITVNFLAFGYVWGFIISWLCTIGGCLISYTICHTISKRKLQKKIENYPRIQNISKRINRFSLAQISMVLAIPFTPAFAVNIAAGLARVPFKKYLFSLMIGKIFLVYFWGFIGTGLVDSIKNPGILVIIIIMVIIAFILSKIVNKFLKIEE
jgi:uncharacterized membrane protein YdjX (TVP38/TMEM64 family)